jgi:uncharacterized protein YjbI with pentapeptide repeats
VKFQLTGADLTKVKLAGADLTGASLAEADLTRANLWDPLTRVSLVFSAIAPENSATSC